jgi:hypothetical protein
MTDDVTRGLSLLADEAEPAPIDVDDVITRAVRTRHRRVTVAVAFGTAVVVGALAVTLGVTTREPPPTAIAPSPTASPTASTAASSDAAPPPSATSGFPVPGTEVPRPATDAERADRARRLQGYVVDTVERVLGSDWKHSTYQFSCDQFGCWAEGEVRDGDGPVTLNVHVSGDFTVYSCYAPECRRQRLDDGSLASITHLDAVFGDSGKKGVVLGFLRADGTSVNMTAEWPANRPSTPLTDDEWFGFGSAFTY